MFVSKTRQVLPPPHTIMSLAGIYPRDPRSVVTLSLALGERVEDFSVGPVPEDRQSFGEDGAYLFS